MPDTRIEFHHILSGFLAGRPLNIHICPSEGGKSCACAQCAQPEDAGEAEGRWEWEGCGDDEESSSGGSGAAVGQARPGGGAGRVDAACGAVGGRGDHEGGAV